MVRPVADLRLYRAEMLGWPDATGWREWHDDQREWVEANRGCRLDLLRRLREDGPQTARELPDTCELPWRSSGWTNRRNVVRLLDLMELRGEVAVVGRRGRDRVWDLAERVYLDDDVVPLAEALAERDRRRLRALGIARATGTGLPGEQATVGQAGEPARVDGVRGTWRVDPHWLAAPSTFTGRTVLLSPLDRLVFDRARMADLFGFEYQLEMYKPAAARRWGYWALPVLHGDRLVGKVDAAADRRAGVLRVDAVHADEPFPAALADAVRHELAELAGWLGLDLVVAG